MLFGQQIAMSMVSAPLSRWGFYGSRRTDFPNLELVSDCRLLLPPTWTIEKLRPNLFDVVTTIRFRPRLGVSVDTSTLLGALPQCYRSPGHLSDGFWLALQLHCLGVSACWNINATPELLRLRGMESRSAALQLMFDTAVGT